MRYQQSTSYSYLTEVIPSFFLLVPEKEDIINTLEFLEFDFTEKKNLQIKVKKEFNRFFRVQGNNYLPPYESFWVKKSEKINLLNKNYVSPNTISQIRGIYDRLHISIQSAFLEPPDHICFELSVYFELINKADPAIADVKKEFIDNHFNKWIPSYMEKLSTKQGIFYPKIADYILSHIM